MTDLVVGTIVEELRRELISRNLKRNLDYEHCALMSEIALYIATMYSQETDREKCKAWVDDTLENYPGYLVPRTIVTSEPPPTPLNTLERMHEKCMRLEEDIEEIKTMGGLEEHEDELETDIQMLTFKIQNIIDESKK